MTAVAPHPTTLEETSSPSVLRSRFRLPVTAQLIVGAVWCWSGVTKLMSLDSFCETVRRHGVLRESLMRLCGAVGPVELVMGAVVLSLGSRRLGRIACLASAMAFVGFGVYIALVPPEVLRVAGCGCRGSVAPEHETTSLGVFIVNGGLALIAMLGAMPLRKMAAAKCVGDQANRN